MSKVSKRPNIFLNMRPSSAARKAARKAAKGGRARPSSAARAEYARRIDRITAAYSRPPSAARAYLKAFNVRDLFTVDNPKILKGRARGYWPIVLHLAPADLSGRNVCPFSSAECRAACLNTAGRGGMFKRGETTNSVQKARLNRTAAFWADRHAFEHAAAVEIAWHIRRARAEGLRPVIRLNGTSDLSVEKLFKKLFELFSDVQFYDYTKNVNRMFSEIPENYHLTFSRSEVNSAAVSRVLSAGGNVAAVFATARAADLPETWNGAPVIDGDKDDLRFLDPPGVVVGLRAKGRAKKAPVGGFVLSAGPSSADGRNGGGL